MVFDWHDFHADPSSIEVKRALRDHLRVLDKGAVADRNALIDAFVDRRTVLDVGVVAHSMANVNSSEWLHGRIRKRARVCLGIDVLEEQVRLLSARGYRVACVDAASEVDLGERFERVVLGEIMEHVDNPVRLLQFARRHLVSGGEIFASTPNCFYVAHILESLKFNSTTQNAEHVGFIPPSAALELGRRAGLELHKIKRVAVDPKTLSRWGALVVAALGLRRPDTEILSHTYCYYYR